MPQDAVFTAIDEWEKNRLRRARNESHVRDQAECLRIFAEKGTDLGGAIAYVNHIMNSVGPVKLMTGHKSKGLEFPNVFILDRELIRVDRSGQEKNLLYVMQTRALETLTYVTSDSFEGAI